MNSAACVTGIRGGGRLIRSERKYAKIAQCVNRNCTFFRFGSAKYICRVLCRRCLAGETVCLMVSCDWRSSNEASLINITSKLLPLKLRFLPTLAWCDVATVYFGFDGTCDLFRSTREPVVLICRFSSTPSTLCVSFPDWIKRSELAPHCAADLCTS